MMHYRFTLDMGSQEILLDFKGSHGISVAGAGLYQFKVILVGTWWYWVSTRRNWLVLRGVGAI